MPKISVVVPVYKVEAYLSRCVDSILKQTFSDFELILVDDGSPDNCGIMCDEYATADTRIHVIHRTNGGLSAARNSGIEWALKNSVSEWVTFIDSDDWIHQRYFEWLYTAAIEQNSSVVIGTFIRTDGNEVTEESELMVKSCSPEDYWIENQTNATIACGKLYKKDDFRMIRYPEGKLHEDEFTTYQILFNHQIIAIVETPIYFYFFNSEGITKSGWTPKRLDGLDALAQQIEFFKKNHFERAYHWVAWCYLDAVCEHLRQIRDEPQYRDYAVELKRKLREGIKTYKNELNLSYQTSFRFYKYAYPIKAKLYRKMRIK